MSTQPVNEWVIPPEAIAPEAQKATRRSRVFAAGAASLVAAFAVGAGVVYGAQHAGATASANVSPPVASVTQPGPGVFGAGGREDSDGVGAEEFVHGSIAATGANAVPPLPTGDR